MAYNLNENIKERSFYCQKPIELEYEIAGALRDLTINVLELKRSNNKREYFLALDNRPLPNICEWTNLEWSNNRDLLTIR